MTFDWSLVKVLKSSSSHDVPPPETAVRKRFAGSLSEPVAAPFKANLLEFVTWCVPDDGSHTIGAFRGLYDSMQPNSPQEAVDNHNLGNKIAS